MKMKETLEEINKREATQDGICCNLLVLKKIPRYLMNKMDLLRSCGVHGKTRIVIEFDNDTGEGWQRITIEDKEPLYSRGVEKLLKKYGRRLEI